MRGRCLVGDCSRREKKNVHENMDLTSYFRWLYFSYYTHGMIVGGAMREEKLISNKLIRLNQPAQWVEGDGGVVAT